MNIFNSAPKLEQQNFDKEVGGKIDDLATELEILRSKLYRERLTATNERVSAIDQQMTTVKRDLETLKKAGKIHDEQAVISALNKKEAVLPKADIWSGYENGNPNKQADPSIINFSERGDVSSDKWAGGNN